MVICFDIPRMAVRFRRRDSSSTDHPMVPRNSEALLGAKFQPFNPARLNSVSYPSLPCIQS